MSPLLRLSLDARHIISSYLRHVPSISSRTTRRYATATDSIDPKKAYSHTLLLPKTSMPSRVKNPALEEQRFRYKTSDELYRWQRANKPGPAFVLHDGPPYANGNLHMGHALNKVLKDIINRYKTLRGYKVHYSPGWDCHGLPIEQKALETSGKSFRSLDATRIREIARETAQNAVQVQKREMQELGVMADWEDVKSTYRTMDRDFEIRQLKLFKSLLDKGYVTHHSRPIYYSPSSRTALAESELKYTDDHKSRSVYVRFPVEPDDMSPKLRSLWEGLAEKELSLAIWTTTAWSLPGNTGVAVHRDMQYVIAKTSKGNTLVLSSDRLEPMKEVLGELVVLGQLAGSDLIGTRYTHTFHPKSSISLRPQILHADHVTAQSGTGLVHSAPAHGYEDYQSFSKAGLLPQELRCPIDDDGRFTADVADWSSGGAGLVGKEVLGDGIDAMLELLRNQGVLIAEQEITHRYPYDWKSKKPIIIRASPQWFADIEAVKPLAVKAMDGVTFHPSQSRQRLESYVLGRSEWCISRQRSWGVPIPALYRHGEPLLSSESLGHIISVLEVKGTDHWWTGDVADFSPKSEEGWTKGIDTLDVWFDSGSSWTLLEEAAIRNASEPLADVYLEGSDQHRGWFQSSLLTRLGAAEHGEAIAPYKHLITHGFVLDEKGQKMSKSSGNGLSPSDIVNGSETRGMPAYGADTLRVWAASVEYQRDVSIGPNTIAQAAETLRKLRGVTRFIAGSVDGAKGLDDVELSLVDRHILHELAEVEIVVAEAYDSFIFNKALSAIHGFASTLSSFYFDYVRDALYCNRSTDTHREGIVATLAHILDRMTMMIAPIAPYLAEEIYASRGNERSVFMQDWIPSFARNVGKEEMQHLLALRAKVFSLLNSARAEKCLRIPSEAALYITGEVPAWLGEHGALLPSILTTSIVELSPPPIAAWSYTAELEISPGKLALALQPSPRHQCPRCWLYTSENQTEICRRCEVVIQGIIST